MAIGRPTMVGMGRLLLLLLLNGVLLACRPLAVGGGPTAVSTPTKTTATATISPATSTTTLPPLPSVTPTAVSPPTAMPTPTTIPSPSPQPTAAPTAVPVDRTCPNPPPEKPDYQRYYLSPHPWPTPDAAAAEHFWLQRPLPADVELELNDWYPYGFDVNGRYLIHNGLDATPPEGTPLLAPASGTIVTAQSDANALYGWRCNWYGQLVVIQLDRTWQGQPVYVLFGHVQNVVVETGQRVVAGEPVAEVGVGGAATNPHMHLEVRLGRNGFFATRHPLLWLRPPADHGVIAGRLVDPEGRPWQGVGLSLAGAELAEVVNTWSYLNDPFPVVNPDEGWAENFVFGPVPAGEYTIFTRVGGKDYRLPVVVEAGRVTPVEIVTEPLKTQAP